MLVFAHVGRHLNCQACMQDEDRILQKEIQVLKSRLTEKEIPPVCSMQRHPQSQRQNLAPLWPLAVADANQPSTRFSI